MCVYSPGCVCKGEAGDPQVTRSQLQWCADPVESGDQQMVMVPKLRAHNIQGGTASLLKLSMRRRFEPLDLQYIKDWSSLGLMAKTKLQLNITSFFGLVIIIMKSLDDSKNEVLDYKMKSPMII